VNPHRWDSPRHLNSGGYFGRPTAEAPIASARPIGAMKPNLKPVILMGPLAMAALPPLPTREPLPTVPVRISKFKRRRVTAGAAFRRDRKVCRNRWPDRGVKPLLEVPPSRNPGPIDMLADPIPAPWRAAAPRAFAQ
jgi:hypothetical protein